MGDVLKIAGGIALFMLATMVTYIWGLKRAEDPQKSLEMKLLHAAGSKVERYLKKHPTVTEREIAKLIEGSSARDPFSRRAVRVEEPKLYAKGLIRFMLEQGIIEESGKDSYQLKKK